MSEAVAEERNVSRETRAGGGGEGDDTAATARGNEDEDKDVAWIGDRKPGRPPCLLNKRERFRRPRLPGWQDEELNCQHGCSTLH